MISRILLCAIGAYFLLTAGYALRNAEFYASDSYRLIRYVLGPSLIGAGVLLAAWRLRGSARLMTAIYSVSVMAALFAFEAVRTAQTFHFGSGSLAEQSADEIGAEGFRKALPPNYTLKNLNDALGVDDPAEALLGGLPHRDVLLCYREEGPVIYKADRYGFRNDDRLYDELEEGEGGIDVLMLGDSFAEGYCLGEGEHLAAQLGALGPLVLNTGSRGAGPPFELAILDRLGPKFTPDWTVMVFFGGNDWENFSVSMDRDWLAPVAEGIFHGTPILPGPERLAAAEAQIAEWWDNETTVLSERLWKGVTLRNFAALQKTSLALGLHFPSAPDPISGYQQVYERAAASVASWGGRLVVVYLPPVEEFVGIFSFPDAFDELPGMIRAATEANGAVFLDLSGPFAAHDDPASLYAPDAHLSAEGARFAAEIIHREITRSADTARLSEARAAGPVRSRPVP